MSVRPETSARLPAGLSPEEEARWWDELVNIGTR
jgi:hypothetical protein